MRHILGLAELCKSVQAIRPSSTIAYPDCIKLWAPEPLPEQRLQWLDQQCGGLTPWIGRKRWQRPGQRPYWQWLKLTQPTDAALADLANIRHVLVNYVEEALDHNFASGSEQDIDNNNSLLNAHLYKRWHRDSQGIRFVKGKTRYTGGRRAATNLVTYADLPSRSTADDLCMHVEWRMAGVQALQRAGIHEVQDLLDLNRRRFWQERLLVRAVDADKLGRLHQKHKDNSCREDPSRTGQRVIRAMASVQQLVDGYRQYFAVGDCLLEVNIGHLLPVETGVESVVESAVESAVVCPWTHSGKNGPTIIGLGEKVGHL
jgi:hypothetical protein